MPPPAVAMDSLFVEVHRVHAALQRCVVATWLTLAICGTRFVFKCFISSFFAPFLCCSPNKNCNNHALQAVSPSISLSELESSFQAGNPDLDLLVSSFRQQLHVQTLQQKLRKDSDQLQHVISILKQQVTSQTRDGDGIRVDAATDETHMQWQRRLVKFIFVARNV